MSLLELKIDDNQFNEILENYKKVSDNLINMLSDLNNLTNIHKDYVNNSNKKAKYNDYGTYVDDVYFQIKILQLEYDCMNRIYLLSIEKCYRDLFKLYTKIVYRLLSVFLENVEVLNKLENSKNKNPHIKELLERFLEHFEVSKKADLKNINPDKTQEILNEQKMKYYKKIKLFKELGNTNDYSFEDIKNIYKELKNRLEELRQSAALINAHIYDVKRNSSKGLLVQTYIISLSGEQEKITIDIGVFARILKSITSTQLIISNKYALRTQKIADEVGDNIDESPSIGSEIFKNEDDALRKLARDMVKTVKRDEIIEENNIKNNTDTYKYNIFEFEGDQQIITQKINNNEYENNPDKINNEINNGLLIKIYENKYVYKKDIELMKEKLYDPSYNQRIVIYDMIQPNKFIKNYINKLGEYFTNDKSNNNSRRHSINNNQSGFISKNVSNNITPILTPVNLSKPPSRQELKNEINDDLKIKLNEELKNKLDQIIKNDINNEIKDILINKKNNNNNLLINESENNNFNENNNLKPEESIIDIENQ